MKELSADEFANKFANEMIDNLRRNVAEDKRRRAQIHGVADSEEVPVDAPFVQVSRCCK